MAIVRDNYFIFDGDEISNTSIPLKHARIIKKNLEFGKQYWEASPLFSITRRQAADIMNTSWKELGSRK